MSAELMIVMFLVCLAAITMLWLFLEDYRID